MPWIDRRTIRRRLILIRRVANHVVKFSVGGRRAQIQLANRVSDAISLVCRAVRVARVRRLPHQDSNPLHRDRLIGELQNRIAALPLAHRPAGECHPHAERRLLDRIIARPILHFIIHRVRLGPRDSNRAHRNRARQIEKHPLRMQRVAFTSERLRQIRIALPIRVGISVRNPRIPFRVRAVVARHSAMRQRIPIRMSNRRSPRLRVANKISASCRITPLPFRIPMPRLHVQLGVLPIGHCLPSRRQHLLDVFVGQQLVRRAVRQPVDARSQRLRRHNRVRRMSSRRVHVNCLGTDQSTGKPLIANKNAMNTRHATYFTERISRSHPQSLNRFNSSIHTDNVSRRQAPFNDPGGLLSSSTLM